MRQNFVARIYLKTEVSPVQEQNLVQSFLLLVTTKLQSGYKDNLAEHRLLLTHKVSMMGLIIKAAIPRVPPFSPWLTASQEACNRNDWPPRSSSQDPNMSRDVVDPKALVAMVDCQSLIDKLKVDTDLWDRNIISDDYHFLIFFKLIVLVLRRTSVIFRKVGVASFVVDLWCDCEMVPRRSTSFLRKVGNVQFVRSLWFWTDIVLLLLIFSEDFMKADKNYSIQTPQIKYLIHDNQTCRLNQPAISKNSAVCPVKWLKSTVCWVVNLQKLRYEDTLLGTITYPLFNGSLKVGKMIFSSSRLVGYFRRRVCCSTTQRLNPEAMRFGLPFGALDQLVSTLGENLEWFFQGIPWVFLKYPPILLWCETYEMICCTCDFLKCRLTVLECFRVR